LGRFAGQDNCWIGQGQSRAEQGRAEQGRAGTCWSKCTGQMASVPGNGWLRQGRASAVQGSKVHGKRGKSHGQLGRVRLGTARAWQGWLGRAARGRCRARWLGQMASGQGRVMVGQGTAGHMGKG